MRNGFFKRLIQPTFLCVALSFTAFAGLHSHRGLDDLRFVQIAAKDRDARTEIANLGVSIEAVRSDSVWGFVTAGELKQIRQAGLTVLNESSADTLRDFPSEDARFHNYGEVLEEMTRLANEHSDIAKLTHIGSSLQFRKMWAIHINTDESSLETGQSNKPGIVFMGAHHAREHLSVEVPLMLIDHLLKNRENEEIKTLLETRDIWIIPMINPDGAEYDIASGQYRVWRKNRRNNKDGTYGVDLNRNYSFEWGTGGSSSNPSSDVYMGPKPFSEPETRAVKKFVENHTNLSILLSFHTYSELILYPWGHKNGAIENTMDRQVFEKMANTMADWNGYTPQQSSDLYVASGDTTDWAYGEHGIFAFTFELSPKNANGAAGFYPGAGVIDSTFEANILPCLYLMEVAGDPYSVLEDQPTGFLQNYVEPKTNPALFWNSVASFR